MKCAEQINSDKKQIRGWGRRERRMTASWARGFLFPFFLMVRTLTTRSTLSTDFYMYTSVATWRHDIVHQFSRTSSSGMTETPHPLDSNPHFPIPSAPGDCHSILWLFEDYISDTLSKDHRAKGLLPKMCVTRWRWWLPHPL